ncbi:non-canonical purine NTP pyrophosphatase [Sorangium sp. So ce124]|uniref:non-canonical purine NTP pyrophosphatase n=1 Tax=Sorangium sp. So ce124 TaxID=3133280 RepID=UPI003F6213FF
MLPSTFSTASAPATTIISRLNRTACTLAVYASQPRSPVHHARLTSGWWPTLAGRGSNPLGSTARFPLWFATSSLPPRPGFAWRTENSGSVAKEPRGEQGYGWDPVWIPDGFERTLAELRSSKYVVNMRLLPFLDLAAELRGTGFEGVFESHVTVVACDEAAFAKTCDALGVRALFISLPRGRTPRQPMTGAHHRGSLQEVLLVVHQLARDLAQAGFEVIRTKVEAVGPHRDLPLTDEVAARAPRTNYFEHHAKVVLPSPDSEAEVSRAFAELGAYMSRGAPRADGVELRFVTLRSWGLGQASADARFDQVLALAARLGLPLRNRTREYTVYDSALDVDMGWMA